MKRKWLCLFLCLMLLLCCSLPVMAYDGDASFFGDVLSMALGIGFILALITSFAVAGRMKMARIKKTATSYLTEDGVDYRIREDFFTHTTRTVVKMPKNNNN